MENELCGTCRFWVRVEIDEIIQEDAAALNLLCGGENVGFCKRMPPQVDFVKLQTLLDDAQSSTPTSDRYDCTGFPVTWADDWCGEFTGEGDQNHPM